MKSRLVLAMLAAGIAFAGTQSAHANAQSSIKLLDADTVRVVDYSGKPPHKRQTISRGRQPELFAYYAERVDYDPQPLLASESRRGGAPGKNLPRNPLRVTSDPMEIAEFARFEEAEDAEVKAPRNWRGAPGKGRAFGR